MEKRIASYAKTRELMQKYDFRFKKNLGQNFLIDEHVLQKIITAAEIGKNDYIIEIGPGMGSLTQELAERAGKVTAIELDKKLIPILTESLKEYGNVEIINEDVLEVDIGSLVLKNGYTSAKIVANLPYYITTPIIMELLEKKYPISSIIVMVQKEVAGRMAAKPGTKDYGALSLAIAYHAQPYLVANVPQNCFMPRPNVDSAVIKLTVLQEPPVSVKDEELMFKIIKAAFGQRRKTLLNCLASNQALDKSKDEIKHVLAKCEFDIQVRGETLGLYEFGKLADAFIESI